MNLCNGYNICTIFRKIFNNVVWIRKCPEHSPLNFLLVNFLIINYSICMPWGFIFKILPTILPICLSFFVSSVCLCRSPIDVPSTDRKGRALVLFHFFLCCYLDRTSTPGQKVRGSCPAPAPFLSLWKGLWTRNQTRLTICGFRSLLLSCNCNSCHLSQQRGRAYRNWENPYPYVLSPIPVRFPPPPSPLLPLLSLNSPSPNPLSASRHSKVQTNVIKNTKFRITGMVTEFWNELDTRFWGEAPQVSDLCVSWILQYPVAGYANKFAHQNWPKCNFGRWRKLSFISCNAVIVLFFFTFVPVCCFYADAKNSKKKKVKGGGAGRFSFFVLGVFLGGGDGGGDSDGVGSDGGAVLLWWWWWWRRRWGGGWLAKPFKKE